MTSTNPIEFRIERSNDRQQPYIWKVYTRGKATELAYSETYTAHGGAAGGIQAVKDGRALYSSFRGRNMRWYFHLVGRNNEVLARSAHSYDTQVQADSRADLIRTNASSAPVYDDTRVESGAGNPPGVELRLDRWWGQVDLTIGGPHSSWLRAHRKAISRAEPTLATEPASTTGGSATRMSQLCCWVSADEPSRPLVLNQFALPSLDQATDGCRRMWSLDLSRTCT